MRSKQFWLINALIFQVAWWLAALWPHHALLTLSLLLVLHFALTPSVKTDLYLLPLGLLGYAIDWLWLQLGYLAISGSSLWLLLLWQHFVLCFAHSLRWLIEPRVWWLMVLTSAGGSSSYLAAIELGVFSTSLSIPMFVLISSLQWAVLWWLFHQYWRQRERVCALLSAYVCYWRGQAKR